MNLDVQYVYFVKMHASDDDSTCPTGMLGKLIHFSKPVLLQGFICFHL